LSLPDNFCVHQTLASSYERGLDLRGADDATTTVNAGAAGRALTIETAITVVVEGLTLTNGSAADGGAIFTAASTLTVRDSTLTANSATRGGAIFTRAGSVIVQNSTLSANTAANGGGIYTNGGTVTVTGSAITGNSASSAGGAAHTEAGTVALGTTTLTGNSAPTDANVHSVLGVVTLSDQTSIRAALVMQGLPVGPNERLVHSFNVRLTPQGSNTPTVDRNVTSDQNGVLVVGELTPGAYNIRLKHAKALSVAAAETLVAGENMLAFGAIRFGDANDNNVINITDFSILASTFGSTISTTGYDPRADFNFDNVVNITDFSLLAASFARVGEG